MGYYKESSKRFEIDGQRILIPKEAWVKTDSRLHWTKRNLNLFDYKSESFRYVVTLSPIKTKIRRLEVCITDMVGIFKDFRRPVLFDYNKKIKKEHNLHLRVLFPNEARPRIIPVEHCRLYNSLNRNDKELVNWFNSYAPDVTYIHDDLKTVDQLNPVKWTKYHLLKRKQMSYWKSLRKIEYVHLSDDNATTALVLM